MNNTRSQLLLGIICVLLGVIVISQYRNQRTTRADALPSSSDQATYISQLYESDAELQQQATELSEELAQYHKSTSTGKSNLETLVHDLQDLRMANGQVEAVGPGVSVSVGGDLTVFELQDLVNELRNASAEAVAVNGVRVVTRSAIVADQDGKLTIDRQAIVRPYTLQAIGEPDTLLHALQRKGGLIALLEARDSALNINVTKHDIANEADWLKLPKTALDFTWSYGQAAP